jgi:glycosyltransferase involved in cell wall biosynthesis
MRIAFVDITHWDYNIDSPYQRPMGGSQSALCYLAEELAKRGHEVSLFNATSQVSIARGVTCAPAEKVSAATWKDQDFVVVQNFADSAADLRPLLRNEAKLILWTQHAHDQPAMKGLSNPHLRDAHDAFVFVSDWQQQQFASFFQVEAQRAAILRNAISPAFQSLFQENESILARKPPSPVLAYTSTPFRGLNVLLAAFPLIREAIPDATLKIYSSMQVYQMAADKDAAKYGVLYDRCRNTAGVDYVGSVPQPRLAQELFNATLLAYPNHFAETSCISVMEAMAAGCQIVTSELGALPETTAGFGTLIPMCQDWQVYGEQFIGRTIQILQQHRQTASAIDERLREQVAYINTQCTWQRRAQQWEAWLRNLIAR